MRELSVRKLFHKDHLRNNWLIDILLLSFFLFVFYFFGLGHSPLFTPDEGRYAEISREMLATHQFITPRVNGIVFLDKPVLHFWLQASAMFVFGASEWSVRFFPALFGVLGCIITYLTGRYLFNRRSGLLAAIILALSPLYFGISHYANLDLEVAFFITSALFLLVCALQSSGKARFYFFLGTYVSIGLAILTKGLIGIALPTAIFGIWLLLTKEWQQIKKTYFLLGGIIILMIVLPWYILIQKSNPVFFHYFFVVQHWQRFFSIREFNNALPIWFYVPITIIGFFPWIIFFLAGLYHFYKNNFSTVKKGKEKNSEFTIQLFLLIAIGFIFLFFSIPRSKIISYILPIFPPLALFTGHYFATIWHSIEKSTLHKLTMSYIFCAMAFAILLLLFPFLSLIASHTPFKYYLIFIACILMIAAFIAAIFLLRLPLKKLFLLCALTNVIFLWALMLGAPYLNTNSVKQLVIELQKIRKPTDKVFIYFKYYQDVPFYLHDYVFVVADWSHATITLRDNWKRELSYGESFQPTKKYLIDADRFWQLYNSEERVFVFLNKHDFKNFKTRATKYFYLGEENETILLSNQPTFIAMRQFLVA